MAAGPIRLLYIDDDRALSHLVAKDLKRHGYAVEMAPSCEAGLERLRRGRIDVVALDHYMPGGDGLATLAAIQAEPEPPPVVYVTGSEESRVAIAALKAGAADYVIKDVGGEFLPLLRIAIEDALARARLLREKEAAEVEVRAARDRFEALAAERAVLLREVNHRVGNSLELVASFLRVQGQASDDADVTAALAAAQGRVLAVGQVHKRLYTSHDVRSVSLDQYLRALIADLDAAATATARGRLSLKAEPVMIDPDRAVAVGVIVTELVLNAMKHAYPSAEGPVRVMLTRLRDNRARLSVEDDGVGPPPRTADDATGVGHLIVEAMADKLGATVTLDTAHRGTRVVLEFA